MNNNLNKTYNPKDFEDKWYEYWLKKDLFSPKYRDNKKINRASLLILI